MEQKPILTTATDWNSYDLEVSFCYIKPLSIRDIFVIVTSITLYEIVT